MGVVGNLCVSKWVSGTSPLFLEVIGNSRQFAFVHFYSVPDARAFLQQYYPNKLNLGPGADRCKVAFSKERDNEDGGRRGRRRDDGEEEWKCRVVSCPIILKPLGHISTFSNYLPKTVPSPELPQTPRMLPLPDPTLRFVITSE